jgi:hypothetical protein
VPWIEDLGVSPERLVEHWSVRIQSLRCSSFAAKDRAGLKS